MRLLLDAIGWLGNACFFSRFLVQWIVSERERRSASPPLFWWLSIVGSTSLAIYTTGRGELVLLAGALVGILVALRNLRLHAGGAGLPAAIVPAAAVLAGLGLPLIVVLTSSAPDPSAAWTACSIVGQVIWSSRFVIQWWSSERAGRSHFPTAFWWVSLVGNALLLAYALHRKDPVLVAGYSIGPIVQVRNLLLSRGRVREPSAG